MVDDSPKHHWARLAEGYDVEIRHGVPVRVSDNGKPNAVSADPLAGEIADLTGLHVHLGPWSPTGRSGESEAPVIVAREQLDKVLERMARASAVLFVDRFRKAIDADDVDWDRAEFGLDFGTALECCHLKWGEVDAQAYFADYARVMHEETTRLMQAGR